MSIWKLKPFTLLHNLKHLAHFCASSKPPLPRSSTQSSSSSPEDPLISNVSSILTQYRSKYRWSRLRSIYPGGFTPSQVSQITLRIRNNPHLALRFFLWTRSNSLCNHTLRSYSTIIHILARSRRLNTQAKTLIKSALTIGNSDSLSKLFETLVKTYRSCDSAPLVFDWLITACLTSTRVDQALEISRKLWSRGVPLRVSTCNSIVQFISKHKGSVHGYALYREIFHGLGTGDGMNRVKVCPNVHTFNDLMTCFYQDGMYEKVEEVWDEMRRCNCDPNACSYSVFMAAYCEEGNLDKVESLWKEMSVKGVKPNIVTYNTAIGGFCRAGEVCNAEELFKEMTMNDIDATCVTYEHLIGGYCKTGDVHSALVLCKDMRRKEFELGASAMDAMIRTLCDEGRVFEAVEQFRFAMKHANYLSECSCYELLLKRLDYEWEIEEALRLKAEMVQKGFTTGNRR